MIDHTLPCKPRSRWQVDRRLILLLFLLPATCLAQFKISTGNSQVEEEQISNNVELELALTDDVIAAIHNGIEIRLLLEFKLLRVRLLIWDEDIADWEFAFRIKYHGLSSSYILYSDHDNGMQTFDSIRDLLDTLSRAEIDLPVVSGTLPESNHGYRMACRVQLDRDALPSPLKLVIEISPTWKLASNWKLWPVTE